MGSPSSKSDFPVTQESIRLAKAARDAERRRLEDLTGVIIDDDGHVTLNPVLVGVRNGVTLGALMWAWIIYQL